MTRLQKVPPPALPYAAPAYTPTYIDQLLKVLRLYFSRVSDNINTLIGVDGGAAIQSPHGMFMSNQDQSSAGTTSANPITYNQPVIQQGIEVRNNSEIWFSEPGQYLVTFSLQVSNRGNASQLFEVWAKYNGTNYPLSNTRFDIPARKSMSEWSHIVPAVSGIFTVENPETDFLSIVWWSDSTSVFLEHYAAGTSPTRPEIPSVILTVNFVSRLP
jgi:hypothetical protein